jgi:two-component system NtrC family sensor kinase
MAIRALVVDDEPVICRVCRKILVDQGFQVETALSGKAALDLARGVHFDFYLSDLRMPEMTGMELYEKLQAEQPTLAGHAVFITGDILSPDIHEFLNRVRNPLITKPFTPGDLASAVNKALTEWGLLPAGL